VTEAFNYHELFINPTASAFIGRLDLDTRTRDTLDDATKKVKDRLRPFLKTLAENNGVDPQYSTPRFRLQGSAVYGTQNYPAHPPEQQVDADLGVYISASFMAASEQAPVRKPKVSDLAKLYFEIVDRELRKLCREEGWDYAEGQKQNNKCCRIDLRRTGVAAHIDVPLYAAPDEQFVRLVESRKLAFEALSRSFDSAALSMELDRDRFWDELEVIVMASRDGSWNESDVQKAIQHFRDTMTDSGHPRVLQRIWRFVKAWRDYVWRVGGGPSSVLLMETVSRIVSDIRREGEDLLGCGRDDRILRQVFSRLGSCLQQSVWVHWDRDPEDLNARPSEDRAAFAGEARRAASALERAACEETLNFAQVISLVRTVFGQRIPEDVRLIKLSRSPVAGLATGATAGPFIQPSPQKRVQRTTGA
jgi:hypothetical protein